MPFPPILLKLVRRGRAKHVLPLLGALFVLAGLAVGGYLAWQVFGTGIYTDHAQQQMRSELQREWAAANPTLAGSPSVRQMAAAIPPPVPDGQPLAILEIPRLGAGWQRIIVQGVAQHDLARGPGHYPGTALPGQVGNFVLSGHRTTHGAPFWGISSLRRGDAVIVVAETGIFTYRVTGQQIVSPTDLAVIAPVSNHPGQRPTEATITLTSCNPRFSATQRIIVHGVLVSARAR